MANTPNNPQRRPGEFGTQTGRFGEPTGQGHEATLTEKAKDVASSVAEKAKDVASSVGDTAQEAYSSVSQRAGEAARTVEDTWEHGRRYVTEQGFSGMADDLTNLIRRNPIPALLVGFCLGFLVARTMD
jgi:ElaB/YqjD/DUF883 family membrane-anchored ribosome-binding protein